MSRPNYRYTVPAHAGDEMNRNALVARRISPDRKHWRYWHQQDLVRVVFKLCDDYGTRAQESARSTLVKLRQEAKLPDWLTLNDAECLKLGSPCSSYLKRCV